MRIVVAFDTNIVRGVVQRDPYVEQFTELVRYRDQVQFAIADVVLSEIAMALHDGAFTFESWAEAAPILDAVIDSAAPVVREHEEISLKAEELKPKFLAPDEVSLRGYSAVIWRSILQATDLASLSRCELGGPPGGPAYRTDSLCQLLFEAAEDAYVGWVHDVRYYARWLPILYARPDGLPLTEIDFVRALTPKHLPPEHLAHLDAYARFLASSVFHSLRGKTPYNPEKRRTDSLDHALVRALGIPAYVCSRDDRLRARLRDARALQHENLIGFDVLLHRLRSGTLDPLT